MRVFELAREAGVSSVDVMKAAESVGVDVSSAISSVGGGEADRIRMALDGADKSAMAARRADKAKAAAELNAAFLAEQKARLSEHLRIARDAAEGGIPEEEGWNG